MKIGLRLLLVGSVCLSSGCVAWLATRSVTDPNARPHGIRVYAPRH